MARGEYPLYLPFSLQNFAATWDGYLGELRGVSATPEDWAFSVADGGPLDAPKIFDHILLDL